MPGPHLTVMLFQCHEDVGGLDAWLSQFWDQGAQWWVGWHKAEQVWPDWAWPSDDWRLIGWEKWTVNRNPNVLLEAYYSSPSPAFTRYPSGPPNGYYHSKWTVNGDHIDTHWVSKELDDNCEYLKGGIAKGKGAFLRQRIALEKKGQAKAKGQGQGKGKGADTGKSKGMGKGKDQGKGMNKGQEMGKGKQKGKGQAKGQAKGKDQDKGKRWSQKNSKGRGQ